MAVFKLAVNNLVARQARVALTVAAIALSVSLVVSVTSGYASLQAAALKFFETYLGNTDATIAAVSGGADVPESLVARIRADARVKQAVGRLETDVPLIVPDAAEEDRSKVVEVNGISRPDDVQVERMNMTAGQWFNSADGDFAVIDQAVSQLFHLDVGGTLSVPRLGEEPLKLKVTTIVHKPDVMAQGRPSLYVPLHTLQAFLKEPGRLSRILIEFKQGAPSKAFEQDWNATFAKENPGLRLRLTGEREQILGQNLQALHLASYLGGMVSMVAAMFIVFSALSMGVTERQRTLAMLRAVGAFRGQIAGIVMLEGVLIATAGCLIGVPLGFLWIHIIAWKFNKLFIAGAALSAGGVLFGVGGSVLAAMVASVLPAWSASRVSPLEAMAPLAKAPVTRAPVGWAVLGLLLIAIDPLVMYGPGAPVLGSFGVAAPDDTMRIVKLYSHFALGLPTIFIGFFLLSPMVVWIVERVAAPVVAGIMGLRFELLRQQLGGGIWRAAGTCTALMVGLSVLIALQVEGRTALNGFKLPNKFPDIFIVDFSGISLSDAHLLEDVPGIRKGQVMPIAIFSPGLPPNFFAATMARLMITPNRTMFIGVDPNVAFKLMQLDFREGNAVDAERMLKEGRHVLVTTEFKQLKGLGLGDKLPLQTNNGMVDYTIAGVVWSPGIDVIVSVFDMGHQKEQRTSASVFGSIADAERDFGVRKFELIAANLNYGIDKQDVLKSVRHDLKRQGMLAGDVREIKFKIETGCNHLLLLVSTVAFAALAVSSLGVTNTIMASIRTRRWQFGILRSIGVTRSQLLRLVIAEAMILGLVGCILGIAAGLLLSIDAEALQVAVTGYKPPLAIPWDYLGIGSAIVMAVAVLAGLWPATLVARSQPLDLLQAGRASA